MIQSNLGWKGNFEMVAPRAEGGCSYYWRDNDHPELPWIGPYDLLSKGQRRPGFILERPEDVRHDPGKG